MTSDQARAEAMVGRCCRWGGKGRPVRVIGSVVDGLGRAAVVIEYPGEAWLVTEVVHLDKTRELLVLDDSVAKRVETGIRRVKDVLRRKAEIAEYGVPVKTTDGRQLLAIRTTATMIVTAHVTEGEESWMRKAGRRKGDRSVLNYACLTIDSLSAVEAVANGRAIADLVSINARASAIEANSS